MAALIPKALLQGFVDASVGGRWEHGLVVGQVGAVLWQKGELTFEGRTRSSRWSRRPQDDDDNKSINSPGSRSRGRHL